jgi:hypothetical protein
MSTRGLEHRFNYHPPRDERTVKAHETIREQCKAVAKYFERELGNTEEVAHAIKSLEEAMFWANASVARRGLPPVADE